MLFLRRVARSAVHRNTFFALLAAAVVGTFAFQVQTASAATSTPPKFNMKKECAGADKAGAPRLKAFDEDSKGKKIFSLNVNGKVVPAEQLKKVDISEVVNPGDTVQITFKLKDGLDKNGNKSTTEPNCSGTYVGITSYEAPTKTYDPERASEQKQFDRQDYVKANGGKPFTADKKYTLRVQIPECYFQLDINTGAPYKPGNTTIDKQGRLVMAATGGGKACPEKNTNKKAAVTLKKQCPADSSTTTGSTASGSITSGYVVTVKSLQSSADKFTVKSNAAGAKTGGVTLALKANESKSTTVAMKNGEKATITVAGVNSRYSYKKEVTLDCGQNNGNTSKPDKTLIIPTVTKICLATAGPDDVTTGYQLEIQNKSKVSETFTITNNGEDVTASPMTIKAGGAGMTRIPVADGQTAKLIVTGQKSGYKLSRDVIVKCSEGNQNNNDSDNNDQSDNNSNDDQNNNQNQNNSNNNNNSGNNQTINVPNQNNNTTVGVPTVKVECASSSQSGSGSSASDGTDGYYTVTLPKSSSSQRFAIRQDDQPLKGSPFTVPAGQGLDVRVPMSEGQKVIVAVGAQVAQASRSWSVELVNCVVNDTSQNDDNQNDTSQNKDDSKVCTCVENKTNDVNTVSNVSTVNNTVTTQTDCADDVKKVSNTPETSKSPTVKPAALVKPAVDTQPKTTSTESNTTVTEVSDTKTSNEPQLAFTGFDVKAAGLMALCLLIIGFGFVDLARRARAASY